MPEAPPLFTFIVLTLFVGLLIGHALARHVQLGRLIDAEEEIRHLRKEFDKLQTMRNDTNINFAEHRRVSNAVTAEQARIITELSTSHLQKASDALLSIVHQYELSERARTIEVTPVRRRTLSAEMRASTIAQ